MSLTQIHELNVQISQLQTERTTLIKALRRACKHLDVVECDYLPSDYLDYLPLHRICRDCGLEEEGWDCGYSKLRDTKTREIKTVSRTKFYNLRFEE